MARYANNEDGYSITDVFGVSYLAVLSTPNTKKGLLPWVCFSIPITMCVWAWAWAHIQGNSQKLATEGFGKSGRFLQLLSSA